MKKIVVIFFSCLIAFGISSCAFAQNSDDVISYEQLVKYKWLFDRESGPATEGKVPVKIEAVIGTMDERYNGGFDMWIKGEKGYNLVHQEYYWWNHYDEPFPEIPTYGEKIIYEIKPYSNGEFFGSNVISYKVIETNVDVKALEKEYVSANWSSVITYEDYKSLSLDSYGEHPFMLEVIIGDIQERDNNSYMVDLWIKGENGYNYERQDIDPKYEYLAPSIKPKYGQKIIYKLSKDLFVLGNNTVNTFVIEENVNIKEIERTYLASLENDVRSKLAENKEEKDFIPVTSYKKLLRNIEKESGAPILLTGKVLQELKDGSFLLCDDDNNYYNIYILKNFKDIREEIIDFNILEDDHIKVYGYVDDKLYTYDTWSGKKKVPTIIAKKVILLDDE